MKLKSYNSVFVRGGLFSTNRIVNVRNSIINSAVTAPDCLDGRSITRRTLKRSHHNGSNVYYDRISCISQETA